MIRILILTLALVAGPVLPAAADGQLTFSFNARNADEARAVRNVLALYARHKDVRQNGRITQEGTGNAASLYQRGADHRGYVQQRGRGHDGSLTQTGRAHAYGLFQSGRGTSAQVTQSGRGRAGFAFVHGW